MPALANRISFDRLTSYHAELGESPVYDAAGNCVWWVDIIGKLLLRTNLDDLSTQHWKTPEQIGFVVVTDQQSVAVGMQTGLYEFRSETGKFSLLVALPDIGIRFNDATTDTHGCIWAGTMDIANRRPIGALVRIDPLLRITTVIEGLTTPNGLAFDDERDRLYLSDSSAGVQKVWVMDMHTNTGEVGPRRLFVDMDNFSGRPDGANLDAAGNYWLAAVDGGLIHVFSPDGDHLAEVACPFSNPTKPAFAGPRLNLLCLTSKGGKGIQGALAISDVQPETGRPIPQFKIAGR